MLSRSMSCPRKIVGGKEVDMESATVDQLIDAGTAVLWILHRLSSRLHRTSLRKTLGGVDASGACHHGEPGWRRALRVKLPGWVSKQDRE